MKGSQTQSAADSPSQEDRWMSQIIVADSLLYQAVLTFINQDIPSYMKGSDMSQRRLDNGHIFLVMIQGMLHE